MFPGTICGSIHAFPIINNFNHLLCPVKYVELYLEPNETTYGYSPYANGLLRVAFIRGNEYLVNNNIPIGGNILSGGVAVGEILRDSLQRVRFHYYLSCYQTCCHLHLAFSF